jgi:hypothetical protein
MRRGSISTPGDVIDKFNKMIGTNERCLYQKIEARYLIEKQRIPTAKTRCNKIGNLFLFNFRQSTTTQLQARGLVVGGFIFCTST